MALAFISNFYLMSMISLKAKKKTYSNSFISSAFLSWYSLKRTLPSILVHVCNPNTQEAEAGESQVPGQSGLHSETVSEHKINKKEKELSTITH
jgi:hypothetical protein